MTTTLATRDIRVNGRDEAVEAETIDALLLAHGLDPQGRGIAVALNGAVLPRAAWETTRLSAGDAVEIVQAKQGG